eukprot:1963844-Rhodomonas_salina.1
MEWYLLQCRVRPEDYTSYVRSYLTRVVQAWMDGQFPVRLTTTISWPDLHWAMIERYLPPDHGIRLKLVFVRTVQCTTLLEYVERWQVLNSALIFAELIITNINKVFQFIQGLQKNEDRRFVLELNPENLTQ